MLLSVGISNSILTASTVTNYSFMELFAVGESSRIGFVKSVQESTSFQTASFAMCGRNECILVSACNFSRTPLRIARLQLTIMRRDLHRDVEIFFFFF